jgi:TPR repeat protein
MGLTTEKTMNRIDESILAYTNGHVLQGEGDLKKAADEFERAGELGYGAGYVELAHMAWKGGKIEDARAWRIRGEIAANNGDYGACLALHFYYGRYRGDGDHREQDNKSDHYLLRAAELGQSLAQSLLAQNYFSGMNRFMQSDTEYEKWIFKAIEQGDEGAIISHAENRLDQGRPLEAVVLSKLEVLSKALPHARKLLQKFN